MLKSDIVDLRKSIKDDFEQYRKDVQEMHESFSNQVKELKVIITPMVEAYSTTLRIGKWTSKTIVFLSVLVGVIVSILEFIKKLLTKVH